jgi:hypothetical protein
VRFSSKFGARSPFVTCRAKTETGSEVPSRRCRAIPVREELGPLRRAGACRVRHARARSRIGSGDHDAVLTADPHDGCRAANSGTSNVIAGIMLSNATHSDERCAPTLDDEVLCKPSRDHKSLGGRIADVSIQCRAFLLIRARGAAHPSTVAARRRRSRRRPESMITIPK